MKELDTHNAIVTAGADGRVQIINLKTGKVESYLNLKCNITCGAVDHGQKVCILGTHLGSIRVIDITITNTIR